MSDNRHRFDFKQFSISNELSAMRLSTDSVLLGAWVHAGSPEHILDIGCGTGVIALMLLQRFAGAHVTAVDIDPPSVEETRLNLEASPWSGRAAVSEADFSLMEPERRYDLMVCNPPYFVENTRSPDSRRAEARHGSTLTALTLPALARRHVTDKGSLALIAPAAISGELLYEATLAGWQPTHITDVVTRAGRPPARTLWQLMPRHNDAPAVKRDTLTLRDTENRYTGQYIELVNPFYTKLS